MSYSTIAAIAGTALIALWICYLRWKISNLKAAAARDLETIHHHVDSIIVITANRDALQREIDSLQVDRLRVYHDHAKEFAAFVEASAKNPNGSGPTVTIWMLRAKIDEARAGADRPSNMPPPFPPRSKKPTD